VIYIYTLGYNSAIRNSEIISSAGKLMEWDIMLSKLSQTQKDKCHVFSHVRDRDVKQLKRT
jgi:hypothetical protein